MGIFYCEFPIFLENDFANVFRKKEIRENFAQSFVWGGWGEEFFTNFLLFGQFSKLLLLVIIKSFLEWSLTMLYQKFEKSHIEI